MWQRRVTIVYVEGVNPEVSRSRRPIARATSAGTRQRLGLLAEKVIEPAIAAVLEIPGLYANGAQHGSDELTAPGDGPLVDPIMNCEASQPLEPESPALPRKCTSLHRHVFPPVGAPGSQESRPAPRQARHGCWPESEDFNCRVVIASYINCEVVAFRQAPT